jgi:hypothetical protein
LVCIFLGAIPFRATALSDSSFHLVTEFPHLSAGEKIAQDFYCLSPKGTSGLLSFECYKYTANPDSLFVYGRKNIQINFERGVSTSQLLWGSNDANSFVHPAFFNILKKCGIIPAGSYKLFVAFKSDSGFVYQNSFLLQADSTLPATSSLSKGISSKISHEKKKGLFSSATSALVHSSVPASKTLDNHTAGINRLFKSSGLTSQTEQRAGKSFVNLWYEDWFVGRYELEAGASAASQIQAKNAQLGSNISSAATTELESYRSLFSQVRELNKSDKEDNELKGEIALSGNWSNGQPEYSAQDNNFYEVRGRVETEVADMPVSMEGYYTTQDAHRLIKGSYVRFHYDAERAKTKLMKLISGYKSKFSETAAKGQGLGQVYGSYLNSLQSSKDRMLVDIKRQAGIPAFDGGELDTSGLRLKIEESLAKKIPVADSLSNSSNSKLDSAGRLKQTQERVAGIKDSASRLYTAAIKKYQEVQKTEAQIQKYSKLLEQYRNTNYFDSALAYSKIKDLESGNQTTYKQMAKSASGLLPEGKAKTFIAGLTKLDAGIINKYSSKYTAAGQQLKGLDFGYDIGFAQIGLSVGKTEYAGRDGSLDKFTTYSGSIEFAPARGQKASLIYYGYTPSKNMLSDDFFKNADIALPTFKAPVHILSATYEGTIAKLVNIDAEAATSYRNGSDQTIKSSFDADRLAWHLNAEGLVPRTPFSLLGSYEHGGKEFQNSTLPVMISGADLYKAGIKGAFFHDFLTAGVEFNHMEQQNFYSTGGNSRWGFEVATHSKQYPSVSLSYKPFATFRTVADTLAIPQRPQQGAVWTGKGSYQFKRKGGVSYRFSAVLNRSTSHTDSVNYASDLLQLNAIYTDRQWMIMASGGQSNLSTNNGGATTDTLNPAHIRTNFFMANTGYSFSRELGVTGGADIGFAPFGLSKYGLNGGLAYHLKAAPITARVVGRYSAYRLAGYSGDIGIDGSPKTDPMSWRQLLNGSIELIWQFNVRVNE